jgi:hypothetical protein
LYGLRGHNQSSTALSRSICIQLPWQRIPEDYESRLDRMWPKSKLQRLRLFALEVHDLALTKLERNREKDRQDVEDLARAGRLDPETLRERYEKELRPNLLSHVERHDLTLKLWLESIQQIRAEGRLTGPKQE